MSTPIRKEYTAGAITIERLSKTMALLTTDLGKKYVINSEGGIVNLNYRNCDDSIRTCRQSKDANGYSVITVSLAKGLKQLKVHQLVALAFISNSRNLPEVNHRDEDKSNNSIRNLEWCTRNYNLNYGTCIDRANKSRKLVNRWPHPIAQVRGNSIIKVFYNFDELRKAGFDSGEVLKVARGIKGHLSHKKYKWRFLTSEEEYESYATHPQKLSYSQIAEKAASECVAQTVTVRVEEKEVADNEKV